MQCDIISSKDLLATRLFIVVSYLHNFSMDKSHKDMYTKPMIDWNIFTQNYIQIDNSWQKGINYFIVFKSLFRS